LAGAIFLLVCIIEASSELINGDVVSLGPGLAEGLLDCGCLLALSLEAGVKVIIALLEALLGRSVRVAGGEADIVVVAAGGHVLSEGVEDGVHLSLKIRPSAPVGFHIVFRFGL
jgi:hypothetical protein